MSVDLVGRVLERMKELGMNPRSASLASGLNATAIRDLVQKPGLSPKLDTVAKLAMGLKTTPEWLAYGSGGAPAEAPEAPQKQAMSIDAGSSDFVEAAYGGIVEATAFRPVDEIVDPDQGPQLVPRDDRYPNLEYVVFDVVGDSMNAADPPLPPGCRVVTIRTDNPSRPVALQTGDIVVVRRTKEQGGLIELSVKELELGDTEVRYRPRSTSKRHQPIVVPRDLKATDETTVEVVGLVIDVLIKVRRR